MKILMIVALVGLANADVSHLLHQQQQQYSGYQYQNPAPENSPQSSYGAPQASVLGYSVQGSGSASAPQLLLPSLSNPSVSFNSAPSYPSASGISIQSYNGFSSPAPSAGLSGGFQVSTPAPSFQASTPAPSVDLSSFQVSSPAPSVDLSSFQVSSPAAPSVDLSSFQVSSPSPSVDLSGFQASTPSSIPSVNLVQYSQPSSSYRFLSGLSQPSPSVASFGLPSYNQFGSDASLNSGFNFGASKSSAGSIDDAFGVVTNAADNVGPSQEAEVSKHLYFFAAPEEEEEEAQAKVELPPVAPKKSYKIIFIKAPTYRNQAAITIPAPPPNEEKTLVYVLVKKPEGHPKVRFQDAAPAQPSKPEVFFIKYKTQKEAEAAVAEIQSKHGASGQVIANLPAGSQVAQSRLDAGVSSVTPSTEETSFDGASTPATSSFESRISAQAQEEPQTAFIPQSNVQVSPGGYAAQAPTPITFGQGSQIGIVGGSSINPAGGSQGGSVAGTTFESGPTTSAEQEESSPDSSSTSSEENASSEESVDSNENLQNVIEQRVGADDNDGQGSQAAGFATYGTPNY